METAATHRSNRPLAVGAALGIVYVVWGSTYLALKVMVEEMPPLLASGLRALTAGVVLVAVLGVIRRGRPGLRIAPRQLAACAVLGMLLPALGQGLVTMAEDGGATSGVTALLVATVPLWVACYRAAAGDRPSRATVLGVAAGFAGAAAVVLRNGSGGDAPTWALLTVVAASMAWAFGSWLVPRLDLPHDPFVVVVYEMLVGGGLLAAAGVLRGEHFDPAAYTLRVWGAWGYLVVIGSIVAYSAYAWLLRTTSVSVVATYAYVNPLVALVLGWLVLSEAVGPATVLGAIVVVGAVVLVTNAEQPLREAQS